VSKCTQAHQVDAKKSKYFWKEVNALSAPANRGYITGNAFARDSTVMPHVIAIVEASVYPSACPSIRHALRLYQNSPG